MERPAEVAARRACAWALLAALAAQAQGAAPAPTPSERPSAEALWREVLAKPGQWTLLSYGENGYRLTVRVTGTASVGPLRTGRLTLRLAEIDTSLDEPTFGPARKVKPRPGLPAQVVVAEAEAEAGVGVGVGVGVGAGVGVGVGVSWLWKSATRAQVRRRAQGKATFAGEAGVTVRPLLKGSATCFRAPEAGGGAELCLAPGAGIVAVKDVDPKLPGVVFAQQGWLSGD